MFEDSIEDNCIWCGKIININGLVGISTNQCPRCGNPVFDTWFAELSIGQVFLSRPGEGSRWVKIADTYDETHKNAVCVDPDDSEFEIGEYSSFKTAEIVYPY